MATELIGTSISSNGDVAKPSNVFTGDKDNPHIGFRNNKRGYVRGTLEPGALTSDFRVVSTVEAPPGDGRHGRHLRHPVRPAGSGAQLGAGGRVGDSSRACTPEAVLRKTAIWQRVGDSGKVATTATKWRFNRTKGRVMHGQGREIHVGADGARSPVRYPEGTSAEDVRPGDLIFTSGTHLTSVLIRCGQRLRKNLHPYAEWHHVAVVVEHDGTFIHAVGRGVEEGRLADLRGKVYVHQPIECSDEDRAQVVAFLRNVLRAPKRTEYNWATTASLGLALITGSRLVLGQIGTATCSGLAAEALTRTDKVFDRQPSFMMPADLAREYGVQYPGSP